MPENVPNRPCAIDFAGNVWNQREFGERDTPATAIPNERLAEAQKVRARLQARVDQAAAARPSSEHILRDDHGDITIPIPIIRELLDALTLLGDTP